MGPYSISVKFWGNAGVPQRPETRAGTDFEGNDAGVGGIFNSVDIFSFFHHISLLNINFFS